MAIVLPPLPYAEDALEPYYSAKTISFHYGKHHKTYVDNLNKLIAGTEFENKSLEEIIKAAAADPAKTAWFNNAAQIWNHTFFWRSMKPGGGGKPAGALAKALDAAFGSYEKFAEQFKTTAVGRFGSGWGWLVAEAGTLKVVNTLNAEMPKTGARRCSPWTSGSTPTTWTIRTDGPTSSRPTSTTWSTGTLPRRICRKADPSRR